MNDASTILSPGQDKAPSVDQMGVRIPSPEAKQLGSFLIPATGDPKELFQARFLCRGGGMLLVGPTGVGKSSFVLQSSVLWSLGKPVFGIRPTQALRILIIQAENDDGDIAEMREGVMAALTLSEQERKQANQNILIVTENTRTGRPFFWEVVEPSLKKYQPDLLIIDPALAYLGGETNSQKDVGEFLRNRLNPLLTKFNCGCIVVHHTNKPPQGNEQPAWRGGEFAYLGSGSAEWANWARGVLAIQRTESFNTFALRAAKRGSRLGWKNEEGKTMYLKYIAYAKEPGKIYWREAEASELPANAEGGPSKESIVLSLIPDSGEVPKNSLINKAGAHGVGEKKARQILEDLSERGVVVQEEKKRPGKRAAVYVSRNPRPPQAKAQK